MKKLASGFRHGREWFRLRPIQKMTEESGLLFVSGCLKLAYCITKMRCGELSFTSLLLLVLWQTPLSNSFLNAVQILTFCQEIVAIGQLWKHVIATARGNQIDITQDTTVIPVALYGIPQVNTHY